MSRAGQDLRGEGSINSSLTGKSLVLVSLNLALEEKGLELPGLGRRNAQLGEDSYSRRKRAYEKNLPAQLKKKNELKNNNEWSDPWSGVFRNSLLNPEESVKTQEEYSMCVQ